VSEKKDDRPQWAKDLVLLSSVVWEVLLGTSLGLLCGYALWKKLGLSSFFVVLGGLAGLAIAMVRLYFLSRPKK
jgi:hypothetical protein